jgi:hypothetical protein
MTNSTSQAPNLKTWNKSFISKYELKNWKCENIIKPLCIYDVVAQQQIQNSESCTL